MTKPTEPLPQAAAPAASSPGGPPIAGSQPLWRTFLVFLGPMVLANILQSLSGTINSVFIGQMLGVQALAAVAADRKSTRLNSSHQIISYAVFCLKKKNNALIASPLSHSCSTAIVEPTWSNIRQRDCICST